jgi:hypothetical protein
MTNTNISIEEKFSMFGTGTSLKNGGVKQFLNIQCRFSCEIEM